MPFDKLRMISY